MVSVPVLFVSGPRVVALDVGLDALGSDFVDRAPESVPLEGSRNREALLPALWPGTVQPSWVRALEQRGVTSPGPS